MRKSIYFMALVLLAGLSAGVVGHDCPEGQVCIQSGDGSSGAPTVEKSGSDWNSTLTVNKASPTSNVSERLVNATYSSDNGTYRLNFDGVMKTNSSCYRPVYTVNSDGETYDMDISAEKEENSTCTQVITEIDYSMEFKAETPFSVEVSQGTQSEIFEHPDLQQENSRDEDNSDREDESSKEKQNKHEGLLAGFFSWLGSIF